MIDQIISTFESIKLFWYHLILFMPRFLTGILLFVAGWGCAVLLRRAMIIVLKLVRFNVAADKAGIDEFLLKGGVHQTAIDIMAGLFFWFMMLALALAILHSIGLDAAQNLFDDIIGYIPNVLVAALILVFGIRLANLVHRISFMYLTNMKMAGAEFLSLIARWMMILFIVILAMQQLAVGGQFLILIFEIAFGGLCLGLAISFGTAGKAWATQILERLWRNSR